MDSVIEMGVTAKGDEPIEGITPGRGDVIDRIEAFDPFPDRETRSTSTFESTNPSTFQWIGFENSQPVPPLGVDADSR